MLIGEKEMPFPDEKDLRRVRKKLAKAKGFLMLSPDADELSRFRFRICQELLRYTRENKMTAVSMAAFLGITKADMSRIFNHRIEKFSTDRLIRLYAKINPDYKLKVA
jgi:predicted XRE-type DNA-binding protein